MLAADLAISVDFAFEQDWDPSETVDEFLVAEEAIESSVERLDLSDGSDGVFGTLDGNTPNKELSFIAPEDGMANIVLSDSFDSTSLSVLNEFGEVIASTVEDQSNGFQQLSINANEGLEYFVTFDPGLSEDVPSDGYFQLTVQFEPESPTDLHADEIGDDATVIDMNSGVAGVTGELEEAGDIDVFQFVAAADGEITLFSSEMMDDNGAQLDVTVYDVEGNEIAGGSTNQFVETSFQVSEEQTYFVSVNVGEEQTGAYSLELVQDLIAEESVEEFPTELVEFDFEFSFSVSGLFEFTTEELTLIESATIVSDIEFAAIAPVLNAEDGFEIADVGNIEFDSLESMNGIEKVLVANNIFIIEAFTPTMDELPASADTLTEGFAYEEAFSSFDDLFAPNQGSIEIERDFSMSGSIEESMIVELGTSLNEAVEQDLMQEATFMEHAFEIFGSEDWNEIDFFETAFA